MIPHLKSLESANHNVRSMQEDIRQLDFAALKRAGYRGAVFDKDNCLVEPPRCMLGRSNVDVNIRLGCDRQYLMMTASFPSSRKPGRNVNAASAQKTSWSCPILQGLASTRRVSRPNPYPITLDRLSSSIGHSSPLTHVPQRYEGISDRWTVR